MPRRTWWMVVLLGGCGGFDEAVVDTDTGTGSDSGTSTSDAVDSTGPTPVDGSSSSDGSSTTGPPPPVCGDGITEGDEECDDGNADDFDACTTICTVPTCRDGMHDGDESDVDCGGATCPSCAQGAQCGNSNDCDAGLLCLGERTLCQYPPSCLHVLMLDPAAATGDHDIDPDADGVTESFFCDMDFSGGGWTRVYAESFNGRADPGWSNTTVTDCGMYVGLLGGYGVFSDTTVSRTVDLLSVPHTEARLRARWILIDSWDGESAFANIDGMQAFSSAHNWDMAGVDQCGSASFSETAMTYQGVVPHASGSANVELGSTLDQAPDNESWGLDNVFVFVR